MIEVAIAVIAAFFFLSVIASAAVEITSIVLKKRSKDLQIVVDDIMSAGSTNAIDLTDTSVWKAMTAASRRKRGPKDRRTPSYISARSFADGVVEGLVKMQSGVGNVAAVIADLPDGPLKSRLVMLRAEVGDDLVAIKAGLEGWFDDTMDRLEGAYKRWSQWFLLLFGLVFAAILNVSAVRIVDALWNDAVLRSAVAGSAAEITEGPCPPEEPQCSPEDKIERAIEQLDGLRLPVGWGSGWSKDSGAFWTIVGIVPTGLAVVFGAQFWFGLLTRLAGARGGRGIPPKASDDRGSATMELAERGGPADRSLMEM